MDIATFKGRPDRLLHRISQHASAVEQNSLHFMRGQMRNSLPPQALAPPATQWIEAGSSAEDTSDVEMTDAGDAPEKEEEEEEEEEEEAIEDEEAGVRESMDTTMTEDDFLPIQQHSRPATPDDVAFERDVLILSNGKTEEELNKHYKLVAQDLGLEGERKRSKGSLDNIPDNTLTVASSVRNSLSQASQSTPPTSCDSSERLPYHAFSRLPGKAARQLAPEAVPQPPSRDPSNRLSSRPPSVLSSRSISSSIRSGWRRISGMSKRRSSTLMTSESSPSIFSRDDSRQDELEGGECGTSRSSVITSRPPTAHRPSTGNSTVTAKTSKSARPPSIATSFSSYHDNVPAMLSPRSSRPPSLARGKSLPSIASNSSGPHKNFSVPFSAPRSKSNDTRVVHASHPRALSPTREEGFSHAADMKAAQNRTARNRDLQRLRASQTAEQARFLSFQSGQAARVFSKHHDRMLAHRKLWSAKEAEMEGRHSARETEIESRQLGAELELERTLEAEKRTVEARLRHMEGYVSGRGVWDTPGTPPGTGKEGGDVGALHLSVMSQFPKREISTHAIQMLNQQRRLKKQLPQLHLSRINVLREQQALKLEKLQAKQAGEWDALMREKDDAEDDLRGKNRVEESELEKEFEKRKERMEWRWKVSEEMEMQRLQEERGVLFAEMPKIKWGKSAWKGEA